MRKLFVTILIACGCAVLRAGAAEENILTKAVIVDPKLPTEKKSEATDKIWSGLIVATNEANPKAPAPEIREFVSRLKRVFGYNQFDLVGSASNEIDHEAESWLVPSQSFYLGVRARRTASKEARGGYLLNLQLFQDNRPLVDTEAKLAPASPLFIRGPQYGKGQIIIVLQVQR